MSYRVIFDIADRVPDIALGVAALVMLAGVIAAGLWQFEALLARWPLVLTSGAGLFAMGAVVNQEPFFLTGDVVIVALIAVVERYNRQYPTPGLLKRQPPGVFGIIVGTFLLIIVVATGLAMIPAIGLSRQLAAGQAEVIEGPVTIYLEVAGGKNECILVADRPFCYGDAGIGPSFNRTRALGGPMRDGLQVRLSLIGATIVRVEVAEES